METEKNSMTGRIDSIGCSTGIYHIILFLIIMVVGKANCQSFNRYEHVLFSGYMNSVLRENDNKTKVYISRHNEKLLSAQELTSYQAGGKFHIPMKRSAHAHSSVLFQYTDKLLNFSKGLSNKAIIGGYKHHLNLNGKSQLSVAVQLSWNMQHFSMNGFTTGSQYVKNEGFDPNLYLNEPYEDYSTSWISAGIDICYFRIINTSQYLEIGFAGRNFNRPVQVKGKGIFRLKRTYFLHAKYHFPVYEERFYLQPMIGFNNNFEKTVSIGTNAALRFPQSLNGFFGFSVETMHDVNQSTTLGFKVHHPKITLGLNQTFYNREVPIQGSTEILLVYFFGGKNNPAKSMKGGSQPVSRSFYTFDKKVAKQVSEPAKSEPVTDFRLSRYVEFTFNSDSLSPEAKSYLDELVILLQSDPDLKIEIMGHTDNAGAAKNNQKLSLQRARSVADYLADKSISVGRINIVGYGASAPLNDNTSAQKRAQNRRVDIRIYKDSDIKVK